MPQSSIRAYSSNVQAGNLQLDASLSKGNLLHGNMLIHGDNLGALECLRASHSEKVQCIYIDPPYNTGNAFAHYDDDLAHQAWLDMMQPRLQAMWDLLKPGGYFFISIDEAQMAYLKVLCDSIFGRRDFVGNLIWEKKKKPSFLSHLASITEYILVYAKEKGKASPLCHGTTTEGKKYPINNAGNGRSILTFPAGSVQFNLPDQRIAAQDMSGGNIHTCLLDEVEICNGRNKAAFRLEGEFRYSQRKLNEIIEAGDQILISKAPFRPNHVKTGGQPKKMKNLLSLAHYGLPTYEDAAAESRRLFGDEAFDYPKPEGLISMLLEAASQTGDLVLDAFLGSGTTAAAAEKLGRKWIGIEQGTHCISHCQPRMANLLEARQESSGFGFYALETT